MHEVNLSVVIAIIVLLLFVFLVTITLIIHHHVVVSTLGLRLCLLFLLLRLILGLASPVDGEASHTGLVGQDRSNDLVEFDGLGRSNLGIVRLGIFIVDIVAYAGKFLLLVRARDQNDGHAQDVAIGDGRRIRRVGLKDEFVHANGDRSHQYLIQDLIMGRRFRRTDVNYLPFDIILQRLIVDKQNKEVGRNKSAYLPSLYFSANRVGSGSYDQSFNDINRYWSYGLTLSWNLFDGGKRECHLHQAKVKKSLEEKEYEKRVEKTRLVVRGSLDLIEQALLQLSRGGQHHATFWIV